MKQKSILVFLLIFICLCCHTRIGSRHFGTEKNRQDFNHYIVILDSAVRHNKSDTIDCCSDAIRYMEFTTGIEASSPGNFFGKFFFLRTDYLKWRKWGDTSKSFKK